MEDPAKQFELPKFTSTEEELKYLRERVTQKEQQLWETEQPASKEAVVSQEVIAYGKEAPTAILAEHMLFENPQFERAVEHIGSLAHREKMRELYKILAERGILNAIKVVQGQNNQHIEDDFHRVLVQYIKSGGSLPGLEKERELAQLLRTTVYEVTLPFVGQQDGTRDVAFKEVITAMERFYVGMIPLEGASVGNYGPISLELVLSNFSNDIVFYVGIRDHMRDLFVKQILGAFPSAKIEECPADYNIFNEFGVSVASVAVPSSQFVYPIQFAGEVDNDPLMVMLNSFTKIERNGEGAAIQLIMYPDQDHLANKMKYAIGQIKQGIPYKRAIAIPLSTGGTIMKTFSDFFANQAKGQKKETEMKATEREIGERTIALIEEKITSPIVRTNIRIVASAAPRERADVIRTALEASFSQFNRPQGGGLKF